MDMTAKSALNDDCKTGVGPQKLQKAFCCTCIVIMTEYFCGDEIPLHCVKRTEASVVLTNPLDLRDMYSALGLEEGASQDQQRLIFILNDLAFV